MRSGAALSGAALVLLGCAHTAAVDDGLGLAERQSRIEALTDWELSGRLIVDTGLRRDQVRIAWEQRGDRLRLTVRGVVIGAGSVRIEGDAARLVIEGRGETRVLDDPEVGLMQELGWWLPVTSLEHWLLGLPDAGYPARADYGPAGAIETLRQRDWRIEYEEYQLAGGLLVPRELRLTHEALELRLSGISWAPAVAGAP